MAGPSASERIGAWGVPHRGLLQTVPAELLPPDALYDAENVLVRRGVLRTRPGLRRHHLAQERTDAGMPTGAFAYTTIDRKTYILVGTTSGIHSFDGKEWVLRTTARAPGGPPNDDGTPGSAAAPAFSGTLTGGLDHPSRFTAIQSGDAVFVLHTNGVDPPLLWDGGDDPFFRPIAGEPVGPVNDPGDPVPCPPFATWTTLGDHVIGVLPPYDVRWGRSISLAPTLDAWPALNFRALADTPGQVVTVEALGTLGGAVYKTDSVWTVFFKGGSEASAFRFEFRGFYEGPAGIPAVVNADGVHYYMTATGRIARFDGSEHLWVADGVWPLLLEGRPDDPCARLDQRYANRIFGVYNPKYHEVWFFYPRIADGDPPYRDSLPRGLVILSLPQPLAAKPGMGVFPGSLSPFWGGAVTTGLTYKQLTPEPKVGLFGSTSGRLLFTVDAAIECEDDEGLPQDEGKDNGEPFHFWWQPGLVAAPGRNVYRLDALEPYLERDVNYGALTVRPVRSYALEVPGGTIGDAGTLDLERRFVRPIEGVDIRGRFLGCRYEHHPVRSRASGGPNAPKVRYHGTDVYGHRVE